MSSHLTANNEISNAVADLIDLPVHHQEGEIRIFLHSYLAQCYSCVKSVHKVVDVNPQLGIQCVHPLGQVLSHGIEVLLAGLERPVWPGLKQHGVHDCVGFDGVTYEEL